MFTLAELQAARDLVHAQMPPTPQHEWPLLAEALGTRAVVKHENHTPTGAFKLRGAITFIDWLRRTQPDLTGIVTATRGNHGQGQARQARAAGLTARVYVPCGNAQEKNAAMRAFGAELIEHGKDFDEAREEAMRVARAENLFPVPPFHREMVRGVATCGFELFSARPDLDRVYVPVGCGSGLCGLLAARDALGLRCEIVGVVATGADAVKRSVESGRLVEGAQARTIADGMAVRVPVAEAFAIYGNGAARIVSVSDDEIAQAMRLYYSATHNLAEGAGAAPLAAALQERAQLAGSNVGLILSGGNVDMGLFARVLAGQTPQPAP